GGGINDSGQVVGGAETGAVDIGGIPISHAYLYSNGSMTDLGSLGGTHCSAAAINASGTIIVGSGDIGPYVPGGSSPSHGFVYKNGVMTDIGTFGGPDSEADAVNSFGQIVGSGDVGGGVPHAFLYDNGGMRDLNSLVDGSASGWVLS